MDQRKGRSLVSRVGESVPSSSLDAGSESGRPINGEDPLVCLVVVPALAPSHLSRLTQYLLSAQHYARLFDDCKEEYGQDLWLLGLRPVRETDQILR